MESLRRFVGLIFLLGILGTGVELWLLEHTEDNWQLVPLVLFGLGLAGFGGLALASSPAALTAFRLCMALFVVSGFAGLYWHYQANVEFELEMYPAMAGFELFWKSLHGAMPALAPATMCQLGLLGLAYTYRHPASDRPSEEAQ